MGFMFMTCCVFVRLKNKAQYFHKRKYCNRCSLNFSLPYVTSTMVFHNITLPDHETSRNTERIKTRSYLTQVMGLLKMTATAPFSRYQQPSPYLSTSSEWALIISSRQPTRPTCVRKYRETTNYHSCVESKRSIPSSSP